MVLVTNLRWLLLGRPVAVKPAAVDHKVAVVLRLALPRVKVAVVVTRDRVVVAIDDNHLRHVLAPQFAPFYAT